MCHKPAGGRSGQWAGVSSQCSGGSVRWDSHGGTESAGLGGNQLADVRDVTFADGAALTSQDRGNGEGVARERHKLDFVSFAVAMDVHNGADIAGLQAISRKISGQDHTIVFVNVHSSKG